MSTQTLGTNDYQFSYQPRRLKGTRKRTRFIAVFTLLLSTGLFTAVANADIVTLSINDPTQLADAGGILDYFATVSAPSTNAAAVYLNGADVNSTVPFPPSSIDESPFYDNFPLSLAPGQSYTGLLFDIMVPANAQQASYTGTFVLQGGPDGNTYSTLSVAAFTANIIPEPSSVLLLSTGLFGVAMFAWRKRTTSRA